MFDKNKTTVVLDDKNLINKEFEKRDVELKTLKSKNKIERIIGFLKISIVIIFLSLEIMIGVFFLEKYGLIGSEKLGIQSINEENINVAVLDIDKQLTIKYVNSLINKMDTFKDEESIKEILIIMNCPGGSPVASDEFSEYIKDFNKNKKINMYVQSMAASGGYYIASAIKPIIANKNAIVGSIGVIMPKYTIKKLADKIGIEEDNVVVGDYKVPVTYFENVSKKQSKYLKDNMLTPTYNNFMSVVSTNRNITIKQLEVFAQGKIFIANEPKIKNILVDDIKNITTLKSEITNSLMTKFGTSKNKIKFIKSFEDKSSLPSFKINLDLNNLIKSNQVLLK